MRGRYDTRCYIRTKGHIQPRHSSPKAQGSALGRDVGNQRHSGSYTHPTTAASTLGYLIWPLGIIPQLIASFLGDGIGLWSEPKCRIGMS